MIAISGFHYKKILQARRHNTSTRFSLQRRVWSLWSRKRAGKHMFSRKSFREWLLDLISTLNCRIGFLLDRQRRCIFISSSVGSHLAWRGATAQALWLREVTGAKCSKKIVSTMEYSCKFAFECDLVVAVARQLLMAWVGLLVSGFPGITSGADSGVAPGGCYSKLVKRLCVFVLLRAEWACFISLVELCILNDSTTRWPKMLELVFECRRAGTETILPSVLFASLERQGARILLQ